jgi:hypothetical protein
MVLGVLSEANVDMVRHIVEEEEDTSFRRFREALVSTHPFRLTEDTPPRCHGAT